MTLVYSLFTICQAINEVGGRKEEKEGENNTRLYLPPKQTATIFKCVCRLLILVDYASLLIGQPVSTAVDANSENTHACVPVP